MKTCSLQNKFSFIRPSVQMLRDFWFGLEIDRSQGFRILLWNIPNILLSETSNTFLNVVQESLIKAGRSRQFSRQHDVSKA